MADPTNAEARRLARARVPSWSLVLAGYAAVLGAFFWRVFARGQMCGWDCIDEYWPDLVFQSRALGDGELPLWNPYTLGGYPFFADPQAGVLTPINWLCTAISWVIGVGPILIQIKFLLLFYAGLVGMHVLIWRRTRSHAAAAVAALVFVLGSPMLVHKNSALIWPLLLLPWAIAALDALREAPSTRRGLLAGLAVGMVIVSHPQGGFYAALIMSVYAAGHAVGALLDHYRRRDATPLHDAIVADLRRLGPGAACAALVAGLWIAAVYVPTWSTVDDSARAARPLAWALSAPLPPRALGELFVPALDTNWMLDIYLGPLALILLAWLAVVHREGRVWLVLAGLSVLLALGANGHVLPWLARHAPAFGLFRIAYRYKLITGFACAMAAGHGVAAIAGASLAKRRKLLLAGLVGAWALATLAIARTLPTWPAMLAVLALGGAVLDRETRRRWWLGAIVAFTLIDLWRAGDTKLAILQPRPDIDRGAELLAKMPGVSDTWRFHASRYAGSGGTLPVPYHAAYVHGARELSGFEHPLVSQRVLDVLAAAQQTPALLTHFNTKYFIGPAPPDSTVVPGTPVRVAADAAPIARLYPRAELLARDAVLARLRAVTPAALTSALVEPGDAPGALPAADFAPVTARVLAFERSRLALEVDAPAAGILVINEAFSPRWRATIDGDEAAVFRANYLLRAVVVPAGRHRVELELAASGARAVLVATPAAVVLVALFAFAGRRRRS